MLFLILALKLLLTYSVNNNNRKKGAAICGLIKNINTKLIIIINTLFLGLELAQRSMLMNKNISTSFPMPALQKLNEGNKTIRSIIFFDKLSYLLTSLKVAYKNNNPSDPKILINKEMAKYDNESDEINKL